jgi:hypothetical protein
MFARIKQLLSRKPRSKKEQATKNQEPYVEVLSVELDETNMRAGAFELDWNSYFITSLRNIGYQGKSDEQIVEQWFQDVCRHIVLETFEQESAQTSFVERKTRADGRTEVR